MDDRNYKRQDSYIALSSFFANKYTELTTNTSAMVNFIAEFETLKNQIWIAHGILLEPTKQSTDSKKTLRNNCNVLVWKLAQAMISHFTLSNNTMEANNVKITKAKLLKLSENDFYTYSQMLMNLYDPPVYAPYGIIEAEMDGLKASLLSYPSTMQATKESRLSRHNALILLNDSTAEIRVLLKKKIDPMLEIIKAFNPKLFYKYKNLRHIGLISKTRGKPHAQGTIAPGQVVLVDKHYYRRKRALYVSNTGTSALIGGLGLTETELHGTPFAIAPGKTSQRISQKLAPNGEYFLLQNIGEQEGGYEVWMKEG